jgi:hypothetical protein
MPQLTAEKPASMTKIVLECPQCSARFNLRRYVPEHRVRCRKCRAIVEIPVVDELLSPQEKAKFAERTLDPAVQAKVARILSLKKLAILAALISISVVGAGLLLYKRSQLPRVVVEKPDRPKEAFDFAKLAGQNRVSEYPIGLGWSWTYAVGPEAEERRIVGQSLGPGGEPQFDLSIGGPDGLVHHLIRMTEQGPLLVEESRGSIKRSYNPPMPIVRTPLMKDATWTYQGELSREGGASEKLDLAFHVSIETLDKLPIGKVGTLKVEMTGTRGSEKVQESCWYAIGKGLVQRKVVAGDRTDLSTLTALVTK